MSRVKSWVIVLAAGLITTLTGAAASLQFHGRAAFVAWVIVGSLMGVLLGTAIAFAATRKDGDQ